MSEINEKYQDELEKLLEVGKEKEYLTYDDINRLLPPDVNSADEIEAILDVIGAEGISISDSDEKFIEAAATATGEIEKKIGEELDEEIDIDLGTSSDKTNDPVRLYLREMAVVPLLNREGEILIAKRIERGRHKALKAISRSPLCVEKLLAISDSLQSGELQIRDLVNFGDQQQEPVTDEKVEEYLTATLARLEGIRKNYTKTLKLH
ncbi:MAG: RNA polymerase sigma factor region1.1 domain-containing protein, partial [Blastocatellia bacterium]